MPPRQWNAVIVDLTGGLSTKGGLAIQESQEGRREMGFKVGYFRDREAFINVALMFFGLDVVTRYFELSWNLLDRSLVFVVAGLVLLGRRKVVERMEAQKGVA